MHLGMKRLRGNALLVTLIALAVLMTLVVGAIQFTNHNREAAAGKLRGDRVAACAESARRYLLSRLKLFRTTGSIELVEPLLDGPTPATRSQMMTGHYGGATAEATVKEVSPVAMGAAGKQVRDVANAAPSQATLGGQYYRVVVKCREPDERESEVEFLFRYGL